MPATKKAAATTAGALAGKTAAMSATRASRVALTATRARLLSETTGSLSQLQQVKTNLEAVSVKLNAIDPATLDDAAHDKWSHEMDRVDLAIARARSALLQGLAQAFEAELPGIQDATSELAQSLASLQKAAQIIEAVSNVLGVIEKVITLAR